MIKICEICNQKFESNSSSRIYCYDCSGDSTRSQNETRKHQKTILRRSMKKQAIKMLGGKCSKCGYDKCIDALEFHHTDPRKKDFKLGDPIIMTKTDYEKGYINKVVTKCILVCSNCHKEIHSKMGYTMD